MSFKDGSERVPHGTPAYWPELPMAIGRLEIVFILDSHMSMSITMKILQKF